MTNALYSRIEAIESFAADVAHELRNPLTSLRSAVETLPLAKTDESRRRLLEVIDHDVKRLDRLISDISDASRLDAELQRQEVGTVDLPKLLEALVAAANEMRTETSRSRSPSKAAAGRRSKCRATIRGSARWSAISIDNARSFSPAGGTVRVTCRRLKNEIEIAVDDDGPGIRSRSLGENLRALLHRPAAPGLRPEFRAWPVDLQADRRGAWRPAVGGKPHGPAGAGSQPRVLGARFVVRLPAK